MMLMTCEVRAASCQLSLSQSRIDYGVLRQAQLLNDRFGPQIIAPGKRTLHLSVLCVDISPMAIRFSGAPAGPQGFRFGHGGSFTLGIKNARLDGRNVELTAEQPLAGIPDGRLLPGHVLIARAGGVPVTGRRLSAQVDVDTYLPVALFSVRRETTFEGQGQFEWLPGAVSVSPAALPNP
ncbi:DUF1120 domain-containing protein [Pseudomonas mucidolens]|nr:hypothetical protein [Pseudomonas mucidolens]